jgi:Protein of unknown function (DUF2933)
MTNEHESHDNHRAPPIAKWVFIGFMAIAGYFLVTEHKAHLYGWLSSYGIWLLLLACPIMHFFHHGHGGHGRSTQKHQDHSTKGDKP